MIMPASVISVKCKICGDKLEEVNQAESTAIGKRVNRNLCWVCSRLTTHLNIEKSTVGTIDPEIMR